MSFGAIALQKIETVLISGKTRGFQLQLGISFLGLLFLKSEMAEET